MKKLFIKALYWILTIVGAVLLAFLLLIGGFAVYVIGSEVSKQPFESLKGVISALVVLGIFVAGILTWQWVKENYPDKNK